MMRMRNGILHAAQALFQSNPAKKDAQHNCLFKNIWADSTTTTPRNQDYGKRVARKKISISV